MPVANHEAYCRMLDNALVNKYAYPAVNVVSIESANAVLEGFAQAKSDGIIQISIGGGKHASGNMIGSTAIGAIACQLYSLCGRLL
jgi:fructose-bisphosphate aldolase class II